MAAILLKNAGSVLIESLAHDGRGVAHIEGKAVFVSGALPGEQVTLGHYKRHRQYDEAVVATVEAPSAQRVSARCAHFGVCGGCSLQHLEPSAQLAFKQQQLFEQLERIGKVRPEKILEPLAGEPWGYRRRARLGAKFVAKKGKVLVGFRERAAPFIADVKRCEILAAPVGELIEPLSQLLTGSSIKSEVPQIEVAVGDDGTALVFRVLQQPSPEDLRQLREFGAAHAVQIYLQSGGAQTITPLGEVEPLVYRLPEFDLELQFLPSDFVQINGPLNRFMVHRAIQLLQVQPEDRVLDLFCGLGNFTLALARRAGSVVGVEGDVGLTERARANARRNGIENASFHVTNLYEAGEVLLPLSLPWQREAFTKILLDPPRAGAREVLPWIGRSSVRRVVYISCHPGSLARDAGILVHELGFKLEAAGALDMFPHTAHLESMAVFVR